MLSNLCRGATVNLVDGFSEDCLRSSNSATWRSRRWQTEHPYLTWQAVSERMPDTLLHEGESYAILQKTPYHGIFDPDHVGITPVMLHTGAPHGFVCQYSVARETLLLCSLEIRAKDGVYPLINDTPPTFPEDVMDYLNELTSSFPDTSSSLLNDELTRAIKAFECEAYYNGIDMRMPYTGTLRVGQDADWKYYRGFIPGLVDWMHRKVLDLKFADGRLQSVTDLSTEMAKIRQQQPTAEEHFVNGRRAQDML